MVTQLLKIDEIEALAAPVVDSHGCDIVLATFRREKPSWVFRLLIEKKEASFEKGGGVDHKLCASISRQLSDILEVENILSSEYVLEVSSAGVERPLVKALDYKRFVGQKVKLKTSEALEGKKKFKGILRGIEDGEIKLEGENGKIHFIPFDLISKANLVFDF